MAFKVGEGFDHYLSPVADMLSRADGFLQWQLPAGNCLDGFVTGRDGRGRALKFKGANTFTPANPLRGVWKDRNTEMFIGKALYLPSGASPTSNAAGFYFVFMDTVAGAPQVTVHFDYNNYSVSAYRGAYNGTLLGISSNNSWPGDAWNFIQFRIKIDPSGGVVQVKVGANMVLNLTSKNTQATANAWSDALDNCLQTSILNEYSEAYMDDIYYCDTAVDPGASPNNTFLGDVGTRTLFLTGDVATQWSRNGGAANFSRLNEIAMDGDTTYTFSANPGDEDRFTAQPLVNVIALIVAVQITIAVRKDDMGPRVVKAGMLSGVTTSYGSNHSVPDTYVYFTDPWVLDPNTTANWTRTAVNALEPIANLVS